MTQGPQESALGGSVPPEGEAATAEGHGRLSLEENPEPMETLSSFPKGINCFQLFVGLKILLNILMSSFLDLENKVYEDYHL